MASLLNSMRRLGAIVGRRPGQSAGMSRRRPARVPRSARLRTLEPLEERTLLSVASAIDQQRLAGSLPFDGQPPPPTRLIVRFDDAVALESVGGIAADLGANLLRTIPSIHGAVIEVDMAGQDPQAAISAAAARWNAYPGVRYANIDSWVYAQARIPNDPMFSQLWGMNNTGQSGGTVDADIDAPETWDIARGTSTVVVADIDTGVDYTHPDLAANMWTNPGETPGNGIDDDRNGWVDDVYGIDPANGDGDPMDDFGHGTHTAGTIGAVGDNGVGVTGVNWNVKIMALKFMGPFGGWNSDAITTIDYMTTMKTTRGVNVVVSSNSWGGYWYDQGLYDAIKASTDAGILFVAAAGNDGWDVDNVWPIYPGAYDLPGIITVAATDRNDRLAYFSNYGQTSVDLAAPGVSILSTVPATGWMGDPSRYLSSDGTSMATPHVAGAVALGMGVDPSATPDFVKQLILSTVDPVPALVNRTVTGGRLNLERFIANFNWAPVLSTTGTMSLRSIEQEDTDNFGSRITSILQSSGTDPITDPNANAKEGIAIVATNTANGSWEYTTNNGAAWKPMGKPSVASARLLAADTATRIRFVPNSGFVGLVAPAITFRAWDQMSGKNGGTADTSRNGGRTAFSAATATASIRVTQVNHAPVLDPSVPLTLQPIAQEDVTNPGTLLRDILASGGTAALSDADGDALGIAVVGVDARNGDWQYSVDNGGTWLPVGGPTVRSALLLAADAGTRLRFVPDAGFYGTVAAGIRLRGWDQTSGDAEEIVDATEAGGKTALSQDVSGMSITVRWVNQAPSLASVGELEMTPIDEDPVFNPGNFITEILTSLGDSPIADPDAGMAPGVGIAVIQADTTFGNWEYTVDGVDWLPVGSPTDFSALLLAADGATRLRFVPNADFNGQVTGAVAFRAWDRTWGANGQSVDALATGGASPFSAQPPGSIGIFVNGFNDAPRFVKGPNHQSPEDGGDQFVPAWATIIPPPIDEAGQNVQFEILSNDNPGLFAVEPVVDPETGDLTYTPAPDVSGTATLAIRAYDDGGTEDGGEDTSPTQTFTITVLSVNDPPSFVLADLRREVSENAPRQVVPGWASEISCGWGELGQNLWFNVEDNSNPGMFDELPAISRDGTLTYRLARGAVGSARIRVNLQDNAGIANDGDDTSDPQTFEIVAAPVNQKPAALPQALVTDANRPLPITLTGEDGDPEVEQVLTFTLTSQPRLGTIDPFDPATGQLVYTPRPGAKGIDSFAFTVTDDQQAGDPANLTSDPTTVQIRVDPVVQVPAGSSVNALILGLTRGKLRLDWTAENNKTRTLFNEPLASVPKLTILGTADAADHLTVSFAGGSFDLADGLVFDGASAGGLDTFGVLGSPRRDDFAVHAGQVIAKDLAVTLENVAAVFFSGGAGNDFYTIASLDVPVRISDSSGADQLDFSPWTYNAGIQLDLSLSKGQPQQVIGTAGSLALAGIIENVIGTDFDDVIRGNSAANRLWGRGGSDTLHGLAGNDMLFGEEGNDLLYGGAGADVLLGGLGDDTLNAGTGRSILIGGLGEDVLQGSTGETIFIGGTTFYDNNDAALMAIVSEWGSRRGFADRISRLRRGVGHNRSVSLRLNATVFDDLVQDRLIGGAGKEWSLAFASDSVENSGPGDVTAASRSAK